MNEIQCNITWFDGYIKRKDKEKLHKHKSFVIWFTGLPNSGKSTIAHLLEKKLYEKEYSTYVLDGDNIRHGLCSDLGYSDKDRKENIRRVGEVIKLFLDAGIIVIAAFVSPFKADRERLRSFFNHGEFIEVYTRCPIEVCASRCKKGLYKMAMRGEIENFTGISSPYEEPENPEIIIDTDKEIPIYAVKKIMNYLENTILKDNP